MVSRKISNRITASFLICALAVQPVAAMQFGGLLGGGRSNDRNQADDNPCETREPSIGRTILGRAIGRATSEVTGGMGVVGTFVPRADVANTLTNEIACRLDPDEQGKAADATLRATRTEEVGTTETWESETRPGVRGSATIASRNESADGTTCMNVNNVVIVDGEETRVTNRMCRAPGEARYTLAA
ncbi:MAG: hypothetical protein HKN78_10970 [Sphingomonadaceae bacterium]|nr:hypothetical protein [Sphingomonadaceae bacterium]